MRSSEPLPKEVRYLAAGVAGLAGGVVAAVPVTNAMGQDQPLGLLVVGLGFIIGPFALLIPALLVACGVAIGSTLGLVAVLLCDSWRARCGRIAG